MSNAETVLVLRTCNHDMTSHGGFLWPESGPVEAPDWRDDNECGGGLHGALWGEGNGNLLSWDETAKWLVVEVAKDDIRDLSGKVKFPRGNVVYCGDQMGATSYIAERAPGRAIIGGTATAGNYGTAVAGDHGTATAGADGTATAGYRGTATAGDYGTATAGDYGTAKAGDYGSAVVGEYGTATAGEGGSAVSGDYGSATSGYRGSATAGHRGTVVSGDYGLATAGDGGTASAGDHGTATAGDGGTAKVANRGTATAGDDGTASAGHRGEIRIRWYDTTSYRYRTAVGYIGEGGLLPNVAYRVKNGEFVRV